jgi:hypothetical protein
MSAFVALLSDSGVMIHEWPADLIAKFCPCLMDRIEIEDGRLTSWIIGHQCFATAELVTQTVR